MVALTASAAYRLQREAVESTNSAQSIALSSQFNLKSKQEYQIINFKKRNDSTTRIGGDKLRERFHFEQSKWPELMSDLKITEEISKMQLEIFIRLPKRMRSFRDAPRKKI